MADVHRIWGAEISPYSVKVRSYLRYKAIPHEWIVRGPDNMEEYQKYAKIPIIPLVVTPDDEGIQDSTPILERLEAEYPKPSIHPGEPVDKDLYDLAPEEEAEIPTVCFSLDQAVEALDRDRAFLKAGDVFTDDLIDGYLELKEDELTLLRKSTHPVEFQMYYSL